MAATGAEGFELMPSPCTCKTTPRSECPRHLGLDALAKKINAPDVPFVTTRLRGKRQKEGGRWLPTAPYRRALSGGHERADAPAYEGPRGIPHVTDEQADPDGLNVFGRYPKGWLTYAIRLRLLGNVRRGEILHVCSGTLGPEEAWTVDLRPEAKPRVVADGRALPFRDASFKAVMLDPPYTDGYARNLYGTENPRPSWLLREAARVVMPCGRIGFMHIGIPFAPPGCHLVQVHPITIGVGFRVRVFTIYERGQELLPFDEQRAVEILTL